MEKCVSPVSPRRKKTTEDDRVADNFSRDLNKILEAKDLAEVFDVQVKRVPQNTPDILEEKSNDCKERGYMPAILFLTRIFISFLRPTSIALIITGYLKHSLIPLCIIIYILHEATSAYMEWTTKLQMHGRPIPQANNLNTLINTILMVIAFILCAFTIYQKFS